MYLVREPMQSKGCGEGGGEISKKISFADRPARDNRRVSRKLEGTFITLLATEQED